MKQVCGLLSTYTADVSGVCSALYEMGGMTIMHDASGCNSTYNTHDEPRWYHTPSMVYISALSEMEAVLGDEERLVQQAVETARQLRPRFVALAGTPIPMMMGTDFPGLARMIEKRSGIPAFGFSTNGMRSYLSGAGMALAAVARRFCDPSVKPDPIRPGMPVKVNLLGVTPLDFSVNGSVEAIRSLLEENGFQVQSCWAMGSNWEELMSAGKAHVNLVLSQCGEALAGELFQKYGTPWVTGVPLGEKFSSVLLEALKASARGEKVPSAFMPDLPEKSVTSEEKPFVLVGEPVFCASLREWFRREAGVPSVKILTPLEGGTGILQPGDLSPAEEDDFLEQFPQAACIVADPLYRRALRGKEIPFVDLPHEGYSGRMYRAQIPVLAGEAFSRWMEDRLKTVLL